CWSSPTNGCGYVTASSSCIRSSYSSPSAFIRSTASPRARNCCAASTCRGLSSVDSITDTTSSAYAGDSRSSSSSAASANGDSGWFSAKSSCRSTVSRTVRPCSSGSASPSTTPAAPPPGGGRRPVVRVGRRGGPARPPPVLVVVGQQVPHRGERVPGPGHHVQQHRVADREAGRQRLRLGRHQPVERRLPPRHEPLRRHLAHHLAALLRLADPDQRPLVLAPL